MYNEQLEQLIDATKVLRRLMQDKTLYSRLMCKFILSQKSYETIC